MMSTSASAERTQAHWALALVHVLGWALASVFAFSIAHLGFLRLANGDMYWQVRAGELMLERRQFLDHDVFSYTVRGAPWNNHEWLFELMLALLHRSMGWLGLRLLVLVMVGGTFLAIGRYVGKRAGLPAALAVLSAYLCLCWYKFIPAAQTLSMVFFLAGYWAFLRPDLWTSWRKYALLAFLLLWGNLSAEVVVFLPFLLADQLLRAWRERARTAGAEQPPVGQGNVSGVSSVHRTSRIRRWLWLALALVTPTLSAPGSSVAEYVLDGTRINRSVNNEFTHLWEPAATVHPSIKALAWVVIAAWVVFAAWQIAQARDPMRRRAWIHRAAAPALAVAAAMLFERNLWLLLLPLVQMTLAVRDWMARRLEAGRRRWIVALAFLGAAGACYAVFLHATPWWKPHLALREAMHAGFYTSSLSAIDLPVSCDAAIEALPARHRMLTSRIWGNWQVWRFPNRPVFIDGRNREFPPLLHRMSEVAFRGSPGAQDILDAFGVAVVLTKPGWLRAPGVDRRQWYRAFATRVCAVYVRASLADEVGGVGGAPGGGSGGS
jgi:hypothetical protein